MIMTVFQYAALIVTLSALGQLPIEGLDRAQLDDLEFLLSEARDNVKQTIKALEEEERR
jgi:hypothetical protein